MVAWPEWRDELHTAPSDWILFMLVLLLPRGGVEYPGLTREMVIEHASDIEGEVESGDHGSG
jgi:hypothetical protein